MHIFNTYFKKRFGAALVCLCLFPAAGQAADHNDPNAINAIYADVIPSGADLYDLFGFPSHDKNQGEQVVIALTFASLPSTGVFDTDLLYRLLFDPDPRESLGMNGDITLKSLLHYAAAVEKKYTVEFKPLEARVSFNKQNQAKIDFLNFPGGDFSQIIDTNKATKIKTPDGFAIKAYIGGRDDAFFNDLPGFFRSINYIPQYYKYSVKNQKTAESPIPKTLLELDGNTFFNYDKNLPDWGYPVNNVTYKKDLPDKPITWNGNRFFKDANGNFRFVYDGRDARAGDNVNAIILEMPLRFLTVKPETDRIVRTWGESWILKASARAQTIPEHNQWSILGSKLRGDNTPSPAEGFDSRLSDYKKVDVDGVPFLDAALNMREDVKQQADNVRLANGYVKRFAHLGWGFGPSIAALGLQSCFDHSNSPVSVYKIYDSAIEAFPRAKKCFFQRVNMPDNSWNVKGMSIKPPRTFEIFVPNVASIDMDTNGTWPFGRRLEDQVATRFLSLFLDMANGCGGKPCNVETLNNPALWASVPIEPKTVPNPLKNDKAFLTEFPYLAEPWK